MLNQLLLAMQCYRRQWNAAAGRAMLVLAMQRCCPDPTTLLPGHTLLLPGMQYCCRPCNTAAGHATLLPGAAAAGHATLLPGASNTAAYNAAAWAPRTSTSFTGRNVGDMPFSQLAGLIAQGTRRVEFLVGLILGGIRPCCRGVGSNTPQNVACSTQAPQKRSR